MKHVLLSLVAIAAGCAVQAETVSVTSPDGRNEIRLTDGKQLMYSVYRNGKVRIAPTAISMTIAGKGVLGEDAKIAGKTLRSLDEIIQTPFYKKTRILQNGNEAEVTISSGFKVILHARNDGVAYRFSTQFDGEIEVVDEEAALTFPSPDLTAYVGYNWGNRSGKQDKLQNSWESIYEKTAVSKIAADKSRLIYLPLLLEYEDGACVCVTESDLLDYPGWNLYREGKESAKLSPWMAKYPVSKTIQNDQRHRRVVDREKWLAKTEGTRTFPWRVFIMADQPAKLVESDIVMALAKSQQVTGDLDWIKPGKVAWEWWNAWNVSGVDFRAGCNTETYKYYVDFAAKNDIEYVIMDEGWSVHLKIMEINPNVDLQEIIRYANKKGVGIILWCSWPQLVDRQHEVFKKYSDMGAKGFKIDFMDRDDQFVVSFLEKTAKIAADYKLLVDYHGMYKPTGMQRAYPNILNFEGVHGLEQLKWSGNLEFPANDCKILFTRMVAGPMDYTPGAMRNMTKDQYRPSYMAPGSQGTRCHQMALMSLFEAPLQMLCDSPTQYMKNQECTDFMVEVPTVWDDTIGLAGKVGEYAVVARRKGDTWYISAITDWNPRKIIVDTSFLESGSWSAEIFSDGINADRDATDYVRTTETWTAGRPLAIEMKAGGGWTARVSKHGRIRSLFDY